MVGAFLAPVYFPACTALGIINGVWALIQSTNCMISFSSLPAVLVCWRLSRRPHFSCHGSSPCWRVFVRLFNGAVHDGWFAATVLMFSLHHTELCGVADLRGSGADMVRVTPVLASDDQHVLVLTWFCSTKSLTWTRSLHFIFVFYLNTMYCCWGISLDFTFKVTNFKGKVDTDVDVTEEEKHSNQHQMFY